MSMHEIIIDVLLCAVSVIGIMYWFEGRSRDVFRKKTMELVQALNHRADKQEAERLVQTERIATLARSLTAQLSNTAVQLDRVEHLLDSLKKDCKGSSSTEVH